MAQHAHGSDPPGQNGGSPTASNKWRWAQGPKMSYPFHFVKDAISVGFFYFIKRGMAGSSDRKFTDLPSKLSYLSGVSRYDRGPCCAASWPVREVGSACRRSTRPGNRGTESIP